MAININNSPSFAPANGGDGTILSVAVKAKELAQEEGEMALKLIESAAPTSITTKTTTIGNLGNHINIKV